MNWRRPNFVDASKCWIGALQSCSTFTLRGEASELAGSDCVAIVTRATTVAYRDRATSVPGVRPCLPIAGPGLPQGVGEGDRRL